MGGYITQALGLDRAVEPDVVTLDAPAGSRLLLCSDGLSNMVDPEAIGNAEENVRRNGVADVVRVTQGDAHLLLPLVAPVRVILANIISSVLVSLLPAMSAALPADGVAILAGILREALLDIAAGHDDPAYAAEVAGFIDELRALPEYADASPDEAIAAALSW